MNNKKNINKEPEHYILIILMTTLLVLGVAQILFRFLLNFSLSWTEELSRYTFILMVYVGAALAFKRNKHVRVEIIDQYVSPKVLEHVKTFNEVLIIIFLVLVGYKGFGIVQNSYYMNQISPALRIPMYVVYGIIPLTFIISSFRIIEGIVKRYKLKGSKINNKEKKGVIYD